MKARNFWNPSVYPFLCKFPRHNFELLCGLHFCLPARDKWTNHLISCCELQPDMLSPIPEEKTVTGQTVSRIQLGPWSCPRLLPLLNGNLECRLMNMMWSLGRRVQWGGRACPCPHAGSWVCWTLHPPYVGVGCTWAVSGFRCWAMTCCTGCQ